MKSEDAFRLQSWATSNQGMNKQTQLTDNEGPDNHFEKIVARCKEHSKLNLVTHPTICWLTFNHAEKRTADIKKRICTSDPVYIIN